MKYAVLLGYDDSTGESEAIATGNFTEMNKLAKELAIENTTKWRGVKILTGVKQTFRLADPKPKRGRKAKKEEE